MTAAAQSPLARLRVPENTPPLSASHAADWPAYWQRIRERLCWQVLRDLRTFLARHGIHHPGGLTRELADAYLSCLAEQNVSWSWLANFIAVLRNRFDRLGKLDITVHMVTPRQLSL